MVAGAVAILTLVTGLALYAVYRRPERRPRISSAAMIVGGGVVLPVVALSLLLAHGVFVMDRVRRALGAQPPSLEIRVVARQWAWEVHYPGEAPGRTVMVMNELRLPAGRPVSLHLTSPDVIHSFWIPSLAGKMDVIPGHVRRLTLQADAPGRYRGQCAEFCGAMHAHMVLDVFAEPAESFDAWLASRRKAVSRSPQTFVGGILGPRGSNAAVADSGQCRWDSPAATSFKMESLALRNSCSRGNTRRASDTSDQGRPLDRRA